MKTLCDLVCIDETKATAIRQKIAPDAVTHNAAAAAQALSDPTRLRIGSALTAAGELCGCDLAWITRQPQNLVAHHLKTLKTAGLVGSRRDGKLVFNSLTPLGQRYVHSVLQHAERPAR